MITTTTAPLVFVEYNYIVPTPHSCRFLGVVRSRPQRPPSCLQNTTTLYRHLTAAGSWEWYDHGHNGTPRVCRIQLHCTDTLQLQVLGSGMITATTAPLVFVKYNYIVPTLHNTTTCTDTLQLQVLGNGTITATTAPLVVVEYNYIVPTLYNYRFLGVVRSRPRWLPRVCIIQLHCTDTLRLQVLRSGMITATTAPLVFVEYNYIVPTPYSCRFLGVV